VALCINHARLVDRKTITEAWGQLALRFSALGRGAPDPCSFAYATRWGAQGAGSVRGVERWPANNVAASRRRA
jgi:hypothetical protein